MKIIIPNKNVVFPKYLYYALKGTNIPLLGYSRHFSLLKSIKIHVPLLTEQYSIVENLDNFFIESQKIENEIQEKQIQIKELKTKVLNHLFA